MDFVDIIISMITFYTLSVKKSICNILEEILTLNFLKDKI